MKKLPMALSAVASLFFLSSILLVGCKKDITDLISLPPDPSDTSSDIPAFTAVGTQVGNPVTKTIGVSGGSLVSDDGRIELTIPAGALSGDKQITIQPITNECPGGIGLAYDLQPEGTRFAMPASLKFHYTDEDLGEMDPYLFFMAYQDSTSEWMADIVWRDVDTLAKTVTSDIKHFSGHAIGSTASIASDPDQLRKGKISNVRAFNGISPKAPKGSAASDDDLAPLPPLKLLSNISDWRVNGKSGGSTNDGTISGDGSNATYAAPTSIPKKRVVIISATYKVISQVEHLVYNKGRGYKSTRSTDTYTVSGQITLIPDTYSYTLTMSYRQSGTNFCFMDNYKDSASMQVDVKDDVVTISNIINFEPNIDQTSGNSSDGRSTCEWQKDNIGTVNITGASGTVSPTGPVAAGVLKNVTINLVGSGQNAKWKVTNKNAGTTDFEGGDIFPTFPPSFGFKLLDTQQQRVTVSVPPNASGYTGTVVITIAPN